MGKFYIKDALDRGEITFQTPECEAPNYYVEVTIHDPEDNAEDAMYGTAKVPLKDLTRAIDWCAPVDFKKECKQMDTLELVQKIEAAMAQEDWSKKYYDVAEIIEKYVDARIEQKVKEMLTTLQPPQNPFFYELPSKGPLPHLDLTKNAIIPGKERE